MESVGPEIFYFPAVFCQKKIIEEAEEDIENKSNSEDLLS